MTIAVVFFMAAPTLGVVASERFTIGGYYKNFSVAYDFPAYETPVGLVNYLAGVRGAVNNRIRLQARLALTEWLSFSTAYDLAPHIQDPSLFDEHIFLARMAPSGYRSTDLDKHLYPAPGDTVNSFALLQNLDRAFLTVTASRFDLYIGRQAIAWGYGHVINPTDVIAPYAYNDLDTEDRIGVDAVRIRVPVGFMGEIDAGYVFGNDFEFSQSALFLRGKFYTARTDFSVLLVGFKENLMVGLDLTRDVGGAGFWMEGAYVFVDALGEGRIVEEVDYFRGSIGFDYSFWGDTYGFMEYHFNGAGSNHAEGYFDNLSSTAYAEGGVYLMGKHYLTPGVSHQLTPLITAAGEALINLSDPSVFLAPSLEYNIAQDVYLAAGAYVGIGRKPEFIIAANTGTNSVDFRSEFGSYPDTYYSSFRIYF
jgi:hypothetical protein